MNFGHVSIIPTTTHIDGCLTIENVEVDLRTSVIKPIHFLWLIENMEWLSEQEETTLRGWKDTGI
jgi:hypothetical protein